MRRNNMHSLQVSGSGDTEHTHTCTRTRTHAHTCTCSHCSDCACSPGCQSWNRARSHGRVGGRRMGWRLCWCSRRNSGMLCGCPWASAHIPKALRAEVRALFFVILDSKDVGLLTIVHSCDAFVIPRNPCRAHDAGAGVGNRQQNDLMSSTRNAGAVRFHVAIAV